jgi:hypothetical protein
MPIVDGEVLEIEIHPDTLTTKKKIQFAIALVVTTAVVAGAAFALAKKFPNLAA